MLKTTNDFTFAVSNDNWNFVNNFTVQVDYSYISGNAFIKISYEENREKHVLINNVFIHVDTELRLRKIISKYINSLFNTNDFIIFPIINFENDTIEFTLHNFKLNNDDFLFRIKKSISTYTP